MNDLVPEIFGREILSRSKVIDMFRLFIDPPPLVFANTRRKHHGCNFNESYSYNLDVYAVTTVCKKTS